MKVLRLSILAEECKTEPILKYVKKSYRKDNGKQGKVHSGVRPNELEKKTIHFYFYWEALSLSAGYTLSTFPSQGNFNR